MKILILTNNFSGLHSFRKEVVKALCDGGHEVTISAPFDANKQYFEEIGCQIIDTSFNRKGVNPFEDLVLMLRYMLLLRRLKPDVVLSYTIKPNVYGGMACQWYGIPQMANITGLGSAVEHPGWLQKLTVILYKIGLRKTNIVFFQNKASMGFFQQHGMVKGGQVLLPGSGVNLKHHVLQDYPNPDYPLRFIFVGRLMREKGVDEYLNAAEHIKSKYPELEFHILGSCEERYEERLKILQNNYIVIYHGTQLDVRPYIGRCHCTVHPSFYPEGMSNVLLESCATGRPIITTDRPGCGEIVEDGINGFVVKQRDANDLIDKIEMFIRLPYEKKREMGLAARRKVEREFDRNIVVKAYLDSINSLM